MRYCIGCAHFFYKPPVAGYNYGTYTNDPGEAPELVCRKDHWKEKFSEEFTQEKFEAAMESADICGDYEERPPPPPAPDPEAERRIAKIAELEMNLDHALKTTHQVIQENARLRDIVRKLTT